MKKKLLKISSILCLTAVTALSGCNLGKDSSVHEHAFDTLKTDAIQHWHECSCGEKQDEEVHAGGTATCEEKAICSTCFEEYGELKEHNSVKGVCTNCGNVDLTYYTEGVVLDLNYDCKSYYVAEYYGEETEIVLPSIHKGLPVTKINSYAFSNQKNLTEIILPQYLTTIETEAFAGCENVEFPFIPNTITSIGETAFRGCPVTFTHYKDVAYWGGEDNPYRIVIAASHDATTYELHPDTEVIIENAFKNRRTLTEITIPEGVTHIGYQAFKDCVNLTKISLPETLVEVGDYAFHNCTSLTFTHENDARYLGNENNPYVYLDLVTNITTLYTLNVKESCKVIGPRALYSCSSVKTINLPDSLTGFMYDSIAYCSNLTTLNIGKGLSYTFPTAIISECSKLTTINISEENQTYKIVDGNLYSKDGTELLFALTAKQAESFVVPDGVTYIGEYAFNQCTNLKQLVLPDGLITLASYAIFACSSLEEINLPASLTCIGNYAFSYCREITEITLPQNLAYIGSNAFDSCYKLVITEIPDSVFYIGTSAFCYCNALTEVKIGTGVTHIGIYAFANSTSLTKINIPDGVSSIPDATFLNCEKLEQVTLGTKIGSIGDRAFENCKRLTEITIPEGTRAIGKYAFQNCKNLQKVSLPSTLTRICESAFQGTTSLTEMRYNGNVETFQTLTFDNAWKYNSALKTVICLDTEYTL